MNNQNVDMFILNKGNYFPDSALLSIREKLMKCDDSYLSMLLSARFKNPMTGLILSLGLGAYGIDRFYLGQITIGVIKLLLTFSFFVCYIILSFQDDPNLVLVCLLFIQVVGIIVWYIVDIFKVSNEIKNYNYLYLLTLLK